MEISFKSLLFSLLLTLIVTSSIAYCQSYDTIKFDHLSIEDGLSHNRVNVLLQGKLGFMWFGSMTGLNKYDGSDFTVYAHDVKNPNSLSDSFVWSMYEDEAGILWVCTWGGGLVRFDPASETFTRYQHDENDPKSLSNENVWSVFKDSRGVLWAATENGLNKFDPVTETFIHYMHDPVNPNSLSSSSLSFIQEGNDGVLWIGSYQGGLNKFDPENEKFTRYQHDDNNPNSLSNDFIWYIYKDNSGMLWIGTEGGLDKFDPAKETFVHYQYDENNVQSLSHNTVVCIFEDSKGVLWVGTYGGGLNKFDPSSETFTRYLHDPSDIHSISSNIVFWITEDNTKTLWFGTNNGVDKFDPGSHQFDHYQHNDNDLNSLSGDEVQTIYEDKDGVLWIGTKVGGLNKFDRKTNTFVKYLHDPANPKSLSNNAVTGIRDAGAGMLWIGTEGGGLNKFDTESETFVRYQHDEQDPQSLISDAVMDIDIDLDGKIWIALFGAGVDKFDPDNETFEHYRHHENIGTWSIAVYVDPKGFVWLGFEGTGLTRFDPKDKTFTRYRESDGLSNDGVYTIYADSRGEIWIGTNDGLNNLDTSSGIFTKYYTTDGLAGNRVLGILEDNHGYLWVSTDKGLSKFNPKTKVFRNYDARDGLQSNVFLLHAACKSHTGELIFGGINGFNIFDPDDLTDNPHVPPIVLTDFQLFNKPVSIGDDSPLQQHINIAEQITLSHDQSVFSIEFAALNYRSPQKNQYAYKLEGFDEDWTYVDHTRRFATYTNLDPGSYTFKVKGSNNDGLWNEDGAQVRLYVLPPWWETWWFISTLIGLGCAIVAAVIVYVKRLASEVAERKRAEKTLNWELTVTKAMSELSSKLISPSMKITDIMRITQDYAQMLTGSEHGYSGVIEAETKDIVCENLTEMMGKDCQVTGEGRRIRFHMGSDGLYPKLWGHALNSLEGFYTNDPSSHFASKGVPQGHVMLRNFLTAPAILSEKLVGQIAIANSSRNYTERDLEVVSRLTDLFAVALGRKQREAEILAKSEQLRSSNQQLLSSEQQLRASNQQLMANEKEREKLLETLSAKNDELQSIVYIASHDLKSPLVNINGFSTMLSKSCKQIIGILKGLDVGDEVMQRILPLTDEDIPESLKFISASASKMKMLLDGLLQVSHIGSQKIDIERLDMNKMMQSISDTFAFQITEQDVSLIVENIPDCRGDDKLVNQVFSNLIGNALKYLDPERKGSITISGQTHQKESIYCVEDNGIGIHPTHQGKVFELFHRLNPEDSAEGQGLGLTIAKRALSRNGGWAWVESEPGKGSKFFVSLPAD